VFEKCGTLQDSTSINITSEIEATIQFYTSLYVFNVTDVKLYNVTVRNSNGLGLAMFDVGGLVTISHCVFENNKIHAINDSNDILGGGGGVYVEFTYCPPGRYGDDCDSRYNYIVNSIYDISHSNFTNNNASQATQLKTDFQINDRDRFQGFGRGGGLQVTFRGKSFGNTITLNDCRFSKNEAFWGGGLKASFQDESQYNTLTVLKSIFQYNRCSANGGGGVNVGYTFYHQPFPCHNNILFSDCEFIENEAKFGGGLAFYSSDSTSSGLNNKAEFNNCTWIANKARYGSAVSLSIQAWTTILSGNLPTPVFVNAKVIKNTIIDPRYDYGEGLFEIYTNGSGAFFATRYTIFFNESLTFENNNGTAMYLTSSVMKIAPNTSVTFVGNSGFNGGAIALTAFSVIVLGNSTSLMFKNNSAVRCGGAIYSVSIDKHDYLSSRSCFIQNENPIGGYPFNVSVSFLDNSVGKYKIDSNSTESYCCGHSIFAVSLKPCLYFCKQRNDYHTISIKDVLNCTGNITFKNDNGMRMYELSTSGAKFVYNRSKTNFSMIPGKEAYLPIHMEDDLNQPVQSTYHLAIFNNGSSQIKADEAYTILSGNRTELYGRPGDSATILLSKTGLRGMAIRFKIQMEHCPPGYVMVVDHQFKLNLDRCKCSVGTDQSYQGVHTCNDENFTATLQHGFWIGYVGNATEESLLCGYCPDRYCFRKQERNRIHFLPSRAFKVDLDRLVCEHRRTGVLCGKCRDGYSVLYHSSSLICYKSSKCNVGWILYLVSEILPLTLMFIFVLIFNINFLSGELNGFIFFAQVFDLFSITGNGFIWFPGIAFRALITIRAIYRFLNFDFFSANNLSFCLWQGATSLDMIAFKFVTVMYALLLIVVTIWLMNKCNVYQRLSCLRVSTVKRSIIHGLSAFLVMVYAQCAKVSFKLLDFTKIHAKGYVHVNTVATYQGNLEYFGRKHFPYTIPAIVSLLIVVVSPVIILTLYPSCFKVISFFKLDKVRCISWLLQRVPHALLKPFADSFQSCFKDNMRFFAGLYFAYRVIILIGMFAPTRFTQSYLLLELILVSIIVIHALAQPYNNRKHNVFDTLLFFNLAVINGITLYNYHYTKYYEQYKYVIHALIHIQLALAYMPLVCFIIYTIFGLIRKAKDRYKLKLVAWNIQLKELMDSDSEDELPSRLDEDCEDMEESTDETNYELFKEQRNTYSSY
jgi:predicted outer membrane repeat protein